MEGILGRWSLERFGEGDRRCEPRAGERDLEWRRGERARRVCGERLRLRCRGERLRLRGERLRIRGERLRLRGERLRLRGDRLRSRKRLRCLLFLSGALLSSLLLSSSLITDITSCSSSKMPLHSPGLIPFVMAVVASFKI